MTRIKVTQVKSAIDRPERQKLTLKALGLNKLNASREVEATAQILGMVRSVNHLIRVEEIPGNGQEGSAETGASAALQAVQPAPVEATPVPAAENAPVTPAGEQEG